MEPLNCDLGDAIQPLLRDPLRRPQAQAPSDGVDVPIHAFCTLASHCGRYNFIMASKLSSTNPYLRDPKQRQRSGKPVENPGQVAFFRNRTLTPVFRFPLCISFWTSVSS